MGSRRRMSPQRPKTAHATAQRAPQEHEWYPMMPFTRFQNLVSLCLQAGFGWLRRLVFLLAWPPAGVVEHSSASKSLLL